MTEYFCKNLNIIGNPQIKDVKTKGHIEFFCTLQEKFCIGRCEQKSGEIFYLPWIAEKCSNFKQ